MGRVALVSSKPRRAKPGASLRAKGVNRTPPTPEDHPRVLIDDRAGSRDLVKYAPLDVAGELCRLDSGDVMIPGNGPDGSVLIGVEVKSIRDFIASIRTGRLQATQIPAMLATYYRSWVLIYGEYRPDSNGRLLLRHGSHWQSYSLGDREVPYGYVEAMLLDLAGMGVHTATVAQAKDAAQWIGVLARWWSKPWGKHKGMRTFDRSRDLGLMPTMDTRMYTRARVASALPGLGFERALAAAKHFGSVVEMVNADPVEWEEVPGVGKGVAQAVVKAVR